MKHYRGMFRIWPLLDWKWSGPAETGKCQSLLLMIKDALAPNPTDALFGSSLTQNMPEKISQRPRLLYIDNVYIRNAREQA